MERRGRVGDFQWRLRRGSFSDIRGLTRGNRPEGSVHSTSNFNVSFPGLDKGNSGVAGSQQTGHFTGAVIGGTVHIIGSLKQHEDMIQL